MNKMQKRLIVAALCTTACILPLLTLQWGDGWTESNLIFSLYEHPTPGFPGLTSSYGIYSQFGAHGILFGIIAPLLLFAAAGFFALGGSASPDPEAFHNFQPY